MTTPSPAWQRITQTWQDYADDYPLIFGLLTVVMLVIAGRTLFGMNSMAVDDTMLGYVTNVFTEALSILVTVVILERRAENRSKRQAEAALKEDLVRRAGSDVNQVARAAVDDIRKRGWLEGDDGLLAGADLASANLKGAYLRKANLSAATLGWANLSDAYLWGANLSAANLLVANLSDAYLCEANLSTAFLLEANLSAANLLVANLSVAALGDANLSAADLRFANLSAADLKRVNLSDANLWRANLTGAKGIGSAQFDEKTVLPDAQRQLDEDGAVMVDDDGNVLYMPASYWISDTDMTRYTDPAHPNYWLPQWAAAGFESVNDWFEAGLPQPWREAGYGDDHMAWVRDGKPERKPGDDDGA